jgi:CDP-diacylglycerol--serine O-phosphatidyltransferase
MGMAMRLARFNTMLENENQPEYWSHYFVGVPAPAAAAIALMPILITFDFPATEVILRSNLFCSILMPTVAFLMVSRIPTISLKKLKVHTNMFLPLMLLVVLFINFMLSQPWLTLGILTCLYIVSIPLGVLKFLNDKKKYSK